MSKKNSCDALWIGDIAECILVVYFIMILSRIMGLNTPEGSAIEGFSLGVSVAFSLCICFVPIFLVSSTSKRYTLICVFPAKASRVPFILSASVDIMYLICIITDLLLLTLYNRTYLILITLLKYLVSYIYSNLALYQSVTPALKIQSDKVSSNAVLKIIFGILWYVLIICFTILEGKKIDEKWNTLIICGIIVMFVFSIISRVLTGKGVKNKIRVIKIYKEKNVKKQKEESYV